MTECLMRTKTKGSVVIFRFKQRVRPQARKHVFFYNAMDTAQKISEKNKGDLETWPAAAVTEDPDVFVLKKNVYLKFPKQNTFGFPPSLYFILSFQLLFHKKHLHVRSNFNTFNST